MQWSWQRIPAEYLVTNVLLCRQGKVAKQKGFLHIRKGRIEAVGNGQPTAEGLPQLDGQGWLCAPGLIDLHASLREPGNEQMETVATGSRAAAAGGYTSVVTTAGTDPVIDNSGMVRYLIDRGREAGLCRIYPTGAISPGRRGEGMCEYGDMVQAGAVGFGEDCLPVKNGSLLANALKLTRNLGVPVISHAEDVTIVGRGVMHGGYWSARLGLPGIARAGEDVAVFRDVELARATGGHLHLAHISTKGAVEIIRRAKADGVQVTAEAAPHHFSLDHSRCRDFSPLQKVSPPLREADDISAIVEALVDGTIDAIASDHLPCTGTEKEFQFDQAPFGVVGLETSLAVGITYLVKTGMMSMGQLISCLSEKPAQLFNLSGGRLEEGAEADFVLIDPDRQWTVRAEGFQSRSANSAYLGDVLTGRATATFLRGRLTWRLTD